MPYHERPYYKKPYEICGCGPGVDYSCTAHEDHENHGNEESKNRFPWGTAVLVILFFAFLMWDALYGGFNPLLFPGACE